ncbi:MAG: hypothetical protein AAB403_22080, partial [Planctomycetota bacterium]
ASAKTGDATAVADLRSRSGRYISVWWGSGWMERRRAVKSLKHKRRGTQTCSKVAATYTYKEVGELL